jgi:hypothetical protein
MARDFVLLLTGTVDPNNMTFTKLQDKEVRRKQYVEAIRYWLEHVNFPIVFVENSGYDLSPGFQKEIAEGRIMMHTFDGNNYDRTLGKGYGELNCIEIAYEQFERLRNAGFVFKVTGRHKVLNFPTYVKQMQDDADAHLLVNFYGFLKSCDSRIFGFVPRFIPEYLVKRKDSINDTKMVFFENALSAAALEAIADSYNFRPLIELARISGSSGTMGINYKSNYFSWVKSRLENLGRYKAFK